MSAAAQQETVLFSFWPHASPYAAPLEDPAGQFLVPTYSGHAWGDVTKAFDGPEGWEGHSVFIFDGSNGENPSGGLIAGAGGVMYGLTNFGGPHGYGTVYSLVRSGGSWNESALYDFTGGSDGGQPRGTLVRDKVTGILYGTADGGGTAACGTAFALTPSGGTWNYAVIHNFSSGNDGCYPASGLHRGFGDGSFFGATAAGGDMNDGTVYEISQNKGAWKESVLYAFTGENDGIYPGDVVADRRGHLLGVASGGASGAGVVYELNRSGHVWQQSVVYSFKGTSDGYGPVGLEIEASTGTVFGTTAFGGSEGCGTVFKLVPNGSSWTETTVYNFGVTSGDGCYPGSRPVEDPATGALYGTTSAGGTRQGGTLYRITP